MCTFSSVQPHVLKIPVVSLPNVFYWTWLKYSSITSCRDRREINIELVVSVFVSIVRLVRANESRESVRLCFNETQLLKGPQWNGSLFARFMPSMANWVAGLIGYRRQHNRGLSWFSSQACQIKWPREAAVLSELFNISAVIKRTWVRQETESVCVCVGARRFGVAHLLHAGWQGSAGKGNETHWAY